MGKKCTEMYVFYRFVLKNVKMLRRVKIMLHVVREENYWLLIIKYI